VSGNPKSPGWFKNHENETAKCRRETLYAFKVGSQAFPCKHCDSKTKDSGEKRKSNLHRKHRPCLNTAALVWETNPISDNTETCPVHPGKNMPKCCPEVERICSCTYHLFLNLRTIFNRKFLGSIKE